MYSISVLLQPTIQPNIVPPNIRPFYFPTDLSVGSRTRLTCEAREGDIPLTFHWHHEGKDLLPDIMVTSMDSFSSTLSISMVREEYGGNYTCTSVSHNSTFWDIELACNLFPSRF